MLAMNSIKNVTFVKWKNYFRCVSAASCRASLTRTVAHRGCIAEILESVICHEECRNKNIADSLKSWINNWFKGAYKRGIPQIEFKSMLKLLKKWEAKQLWTTSAHFSFGSGTTGFQAITSIQCPDVWSFLYLPACITTFYHSLHSCPVHVFLNLLSQLLNSCLLRRMSLYPPLLPVFTCLPLVSFLSIFLRFSITLSPLLIPLADPQREPREWVGLKRERSAVLYPARSSLARLKHSEEKRKKKHNTHTQHRKTESFFPLSHFLFPPSLYSSLTSLLSCLISHFYSPSAGAQIWAPWTQTRKPPELQCYTSSSIPSSSLFLALPVTFSSRVHQCNVLCLTEQQWEEKKGWNTPTDTHIFTDNVQCETVASAPVSDEDRFASFSVEIIDYEK